MPLRVERGPSRGVEGPGAVSEAGLLPASSVKSPLTRNLTRLTTGCDGPSEAASLRVPEPPGVEPELFAEPLTECGVDLADPAGGLPELGDSGSSTSGLVPGTKRSSCTVIVVRLGGGRLRRIIFQL